VIYGERPGQLQAFLSRGVVAYTANTGYGWGLTNGIGYAERLVQLFTEELSRGGTQAAGEVVRRTKQRYLLETPRYDAYDEKTLMQWTLFGDADAVALVLDDDGPTQTAKRSRPPRQRRKLTPPDEGALGSARRPRGAGTTRGTRVAIVTAATL
jgi:hypothetical protein